MDPRHDAPIRLDPRFDGESFRAGVRISARDAAAGTSVIYSLPNEDGGRFLLEVVIPSGIQDRQQIRLKGQGLVVGSGEPRDLYLEVSVYEKAEGTVVREAGSTATAPPAPRHETRDPESEHVASEPAKVERAKGNSGKIWAGVGLLAGGLALVGFVFAASHIQSKRNARNEALMDLNNALFESRYGVGSEIEDVPGDELLLLDERLAPIFDAGPIIRVGPEEGALAQAIENAAEGSTITLSQGTYFLEATVEKSLKIVGNETNVRLTSPESSLLPVLDVRDGASLYLKTLAVVGNGVESELISYGLVTLKGSDLGASLLLDQVEVVSSGGNGVHGYGDCEALVFESTIRDCLGEGIRMVQAEYFEESQRSANAEINHGLTIFYSEFLNNYGAAIVVDDLPLKVTDSLISNHNAMRFEMDEANRETRYAVGAIHLQGDADAQLTGVEFADPNGYLRTLVTLLGDGDALLDEVIWEGKEIPYTYKGAKMPNEG